MATTFIFKIKKISKVDRTLALKTGVTFGYSITRKWFSLSISKWISHALLSYRTAETLYYYTGCLLKCL